jgi:hypothetical protein
MNTVPQRRDNRIRDFDFELDQLLLELVLGRRPDWRQPDGFCPQCWQEIDRLRRRGKPRPGMQA